MQQVNHISCRDILTQCLKASLKHISMIYSRLMIDASDSLYLQYLVSSTKITKIKTDGFSIIYSIHYSNKLVNVFFAGCISLITQIISL